MTRFRIVRFLINVMPLVAAGVVYLSVRIYYDGI
jgi:hypothetical protein